MAKYKIGDVEVEAITFEEFVQDISKYAHFLPSKTGENCYSIKLPGGRVYFSKDEMLVFLKKRVFKFPKITFEEDFIKV